MHCSGQLLPAIGTGPPDPRSQAEKPSAVAEALGAANAGAGAETAPAAAGGAVVAGVAEVAAKDKHAVVRHKTMTIKAGFIGLSSR